MTPLGEFVRRPWTAVRLLAALAIPVHGALSQGIDGRPREPRGFDFRPDGVWRVRARQVRVARASALARDDFRSLNSALAFRAPVGLRAQAAPSPTAVSGVIRVPYFLVSFRNTDTTTLRPIAAYDTMLTFATAPPGRPYTVRTFYEEMSNGLLSLQGEILSRTALDSNDTWYEGNCNALCDFGASPGRMPQLMREAISRVDGSVNFGRYDNDGPDGVPNSGDDDGTVDVAAFIQPELGAECQGLDASSSRNVWSHRSSYSEWTGAPYVTNDPRVGGGFIRIDNYIIQPGVGGADGCTGSQIMGIGTLAHEMGHGLGLDDLYDANPEDEDYSSGVGNWGLMGTGSWTTQLSPASMEAFSRAELGWIAVRPLTLPGSYQLGASAVGDTAFLIRPTVANPRGEYFLLENRQSALSDTALIRMTGPGLLIWHVDSTKYAQSFLWNDVNSGPIHAVWLRQADGLNQLRSSTPGVENRGDAGDPYPGSSANTAFGFATNPSATLNANGSFAGFIVDSIRQVVPGGEMAFRFRFAGMTTVRASDSTAQVRVRTVAYNVYRDVFSEGDTVTIAIDSSQMSPDGRTEFLFSAWSDLGTRSHRATMTLAGTALIATVSRKFKTQVSVAGTGTLASTVNLVNGAFLGEGDSVTLTATPGAGFAFLNWTGDTTAAGASITLRMTHPWNVTANFRAQLAVSDTALRAPLMGAPYQDTVRMTAGGTVTFALQAGSLPPGLSLTARGVINGTPTRDSAYTFTVRATSGAETLDLPLRLAVTAPTLVLANVVSQFLLGGTALTTAERKYLDLIGNNNNQLDIGDFVAWLDKTGTAADAATIARIAGRGAR